MRQPIRSPDNRYVVRFTQVEMRMSHWLDCPVLVESAGGDPLLDLGETLWSAEGVEWAPDSRHVVLLLRRYPGDAPAVTVEIDLAAGICQVRLPGAPASVALWALPVWLEHWYERQAAP
jgi:hypothetical protein